MGIRFTDNQLRQALGALIAAVVAVAAAYGFDASFLNSPVIFGLIFAGCSVVMSLIIPDRNREPSLTDAYRTIERANQAREAERWRCNDDPRRVSEPDEYTRSEP